MAIGNRYDFLMLFDVEYGNPNGDPDAGNCPRIDPETNIGYITDVCLKRKIRNFVGLYKEGEPGYNILIKPDRSLNSKFTEAYEKEEVKRKNGRKKDDDVKKVRDYMCRNYFDVRTFGAVMSTGDNPCGIVRGPVQINFARSLSPVNILDICITRQARTTEERTVTGSTEIGRKVIIPYALYRAEGYVSAALANKGTGLSEEDLEILWTAIINMFEHDHSATRGKMCMRKLFVYKHRCLLGNCPSDMLFDRIRIELKNDSKPPRSFNDYRITVDEQMPEGVELIEML